MFVVRCIGISLAVFVLLFTAFSLFVSGAWQLTLRICNRLSVRHAADFLFVLRILPFVASAALTLAFAVPSYLLFEPVSIVEPMGFGSVALGVCCLVLLIVGMFRAAGAQRRTSRLLAQWMGGATRMPSSVQVPVFCTVRDAPLFTVVGVYSPRVLVSRTAVSILDQDELQTALRHEMAHVRRYDNLKRLLFRFSPFPGMSRLETSWSQFTEMAADDAAVSSAADALDLAAALIKLSRFASAQPSLELASAFLHSSTANLTARIERLFQWTESHRTPAQKTPFWYVLPPVVIGAIAIITTYGTALNHIHAATEWLIR